MRIVIDMQGAQTESRFRGIGRYTMSLAQAVARNRGEHELYLVLSSVFPDTIERIRAAFEGILPQANIRVWHVPNPTGPAEPFEQSWFEVAAPMREAFLASLQPDIIHISSLFEGFSDRAVTDVGSLAILCPVSVTLYDLIPLVNPDEYLKLHPHFARSYEHKVRELNKAALHLAISEFSREEGVRHLARPLKDVVNVSTATDPCFSIREIEGAEASAMLQSFGVTKPYLLYTGGADERKNLSRLIKAFGQLPRSLRKRYQLLLVGKIPEQIVADLKTTARMVGLQSEDTIFTGYASDEQLVQLYNLCAVFVFPSWHEGFGLPPLEAMACGAPVIGSNCSSIPEVIGLDDALFDPFDVDSITTKITRVLEDDNFRAMLKQHAIAQAGKFSWDKTATRAIRAWEASYSAFGRKASGRVRPEVGTNPMREIARRAREWHVGAVVELAECLAKNQRAGIERQLLLDVSELCQHDSATGVQRVVRSYLHELFSAAPSGFRVEPVYATQQEGYRYARAFAARFMGTEGNSVSDDPVRWQRGDVFFGLDMQHHVQLRHQEFFRRLRQDGVTVKFLVHDLLPIELEQDFEIPNAKDLHEQWLRMIARTHGAICVSKATADAYRNWMQAHNIQPARGFQLATVHNGADMGRRKASRRTASDDPPVFSAMKNRPTFLCVATIEPRKGHAQILAAFDLLWNEGLDVNLIFVGQKGWMVDSLTERLETHQESDRRLFWLHGISDEVLDKLYVESTCLISASKGEGFGLPIVEAARCGTPIIVRDMPVFREVAGEFAFYFSGESPEDLARALKEWLGLYREQRHPCPHGLRFSTWGESTENLIAALLGQNYARHQLLVDISELVHHDAGTGIQRLVRSILSEWLRCPPKGYRVEPVYATVDRSYRYARRFVDAIGSGACADVQDEPIECAPGDVFLGLDLQPHVVPARMDELHRLHREGVRIWFMVYDLIAVHRPECFRENMPRLFQQWLSTITQFDGAICISAAVANDLKGWMRENGTECRPGFSIEWVHPGVDIPDRKDAEESKVTGNVVLERMQQVRTFLMVGTLEPRKGYLQALEAFEGLWKGGVDVNLVIVGKLGWKMERLGEKLRNHPEGDRRLFWLGRVSDEYLDKIYEFSDALIAASEAEGFGLPLIEAAQHELPIIARDIAAFREVAGEHAFYFSGRNSMALSDAIKDWLKLRENDEQPRSGGIRYLSWRESAESILNIILADGCALLREASMAGASGASEEGCAVRGDTPSDMVS